MRITLEISALRLTIWALGLVGFLWVPAYNMTHPIQQVGDDWYGPYVFFAGTSLLVGLALQPLWRWLRKWRSLTVLG